MLFRVEKYTPWDTGSQIITRIITADVFTSRSRLYYIIYNNKLLEFIIDY